LRAKWVVVFLALAACGGRRERAPAADAGRDGSAGAEPRAAIEDLPAAPACAERACEPVTIATLPIDRGTALALDGAGFAYVGELYGDRIFRVPLAPGAPTPPTVLYRSPGRDIGALEVRGDLLRWSSSAAGAIYEAPLAGTGPIRVVADGMPGIWGFATDERWIYWADFGGAVPGMLWKTPIGGGSSTGLGRDPTSRLATNVMLDGPGGDLVYTDRTPRLLRVSPAGGPPTVWIQLPGRRESHGLAQDATHVYLETLSANEVLRIDRQTRRIERFARTPAAPAAIAVDDTHVYWIDYIGPVTLRAQRK